jgi:hypothetical protein
MEIIADWNRLLEGCSNGPRLELFARGPRVGWTVWGNQADDYVPTWDTYSNHSQAEIIAMKGRKTGQRVEVDEVDAFRVDVVPQHGQVVAVVGGGLSSARPAFAESYPVEAVNGK